MNKEKIKQSQRSRRGLRAKAKIKGIKDIPRLSVFRSNKGIYAQIIDDKKGSTVVGASTQEVKDNKNKIESAKEVGKLLAEKALEKNIKKVIFDKSFYKYHGRIKALADAAREAGLEF